MKSCTDQSYSLLYNDEIKHTNHFSKSNYFFGAREEQPLRHISANYYSDAQVTPRAELKFEKTLLTNVKQAQCPQHSGQSSSICYE